MTITFIGLGLIGGSLAISLRENHFGSRFIGVDLNPVHCEQALKLKLVDEIMPMEKAVFLSDLVLISIPVDQTCRILPQILNEIGPNTVVSDMGSTKEGICESIKNHQHRRNFVASHPIAGTENSGPTAAISGLYENKITIICEKEKSYPEAVELLVKMYNLLNMNILYMPPAEHDLHLAYVSHLSHISSFTLGLTVLEIEKEEKHIFNLAGSGFASTVRLAKSSPEMWAPILMQNSEHLIQALTNYIDILNDFRTAIEQKDTTKLKTMMKEANQIRRVLDKKNT
jgi:prephenate dehydrogenase